VNLDEGRFARVFSEFVALADAGGGLQPWFDALEAKRRIFAGGDIAAMLDAVFTARRRLDVARAREIAERGLAALALPEDRKLRGAAHDFAAELAHFRDPVRQPLGTRWAIDALREFGAEEPGADPAEAREWLYGCVKAQGIYREAHWWADLTLGMAYVGYLRAMTGGVLGSDFTRAMTPGEQLTRLLGLKERSLADS
jgi:hypothetical protein